MDRLEILASRLRRLFSRNRWSARLLGYVPGGGDHPEAGLVLMQIDGLGYDVVQRAVREGRMPFLKYLLDHEDQQLRPMYTGMPSSTPGFQAEFFYGVKGAVPAFGYFNSSLGRIVSMNDPTAASAVEDKLQKEAEGLMRGGSSWSNIFHGDADEPHLCASTAGLEMIWQALNPFRMLGLVLWYGWSLVLIFAYTLVELALATYDFTLGTLAGHSFFAELRFVPTRVIVSAVMREIVTAGASIDCERGLPIIQLNFLGYDEHAHRRGPDSRFARWTLKGIDHSLRRVWLAAHRSKHRDYQVWIYSDHGQEPTVPYPRERPEDLGRAVERVVRRFELNEAQDYELKRKRAPHMPPEMGRSQWLRTELPLWMQGRRGAELASRVEMGPAPTPPKVLRVAHQGPTGFVYPAHEMTHEAHLRLARLIAKTAAVPMVMVAEGDGAVVFRRKGPACRLPEDAAEVFGSDHPYLKHVTSDSLRLLHHPDAGPLALFGYQPGKPMSLQTENGAHGGPGPRECTAFVLLPKEATLGQPMEGVLRPIHLREMALRSLAGIILPDRKLTRRLARVRQPPRYERKPRLHLRVASYNVHGCRGMDGKFSPQRIARVLSRLQADIICLQELDDKRERSGSVRQVELISRSLQTDFRFHAVNSFVDGKFGNAILSHYPLRMVDQAGLPSLKGFPGLEERGILWVEADIEGSKIQVLNTHLSILERERRLQVEFLLQRGWLGAELDRVPLILCGDLNAGMSSWTCRRLSEVLSNVGSGPTRVVVPRTWSGRLPLRRIDHVYTTDFVRTDRVIVPRNRLTRVASDHLPLVVDFSLVAEEAKEDLPPRVQSR